MRTVPIKAKFDRNFIYNLQTLNIKHKLKQLEIQKQVPCKQHLQFNRAMPYLPPVFWYVQWADCDFPWSLSTDASLNQSLHTAFMAISQEKTVGKWDFFFFFQLSHKCHWSVLVMTKKWLILQGNSPAGLGVVWGMETPSNCTHGPLKLLSATVICTAVTALVCFSLPSSRTLKYNSTCSDNTFWTWKALAVGTRHHRLPTAVPKESSFLFGSHAWWDAQVSLLSCVLLVFLIGRFETMQ